MFTSVTEEQLKKYYESCKLYLPPHSNFRQWKFAKNGFFFIVPDRIRSEKILRSWLLKILPEHVYFSVSQWLSPTETRQSFLTKAGYTTLSKCVVSTDFAFDVDGNTIQKAQQETIKIMDYLNSNNIKFNLRFSGKKGYHIFLEDFKFPISENISDREGEILDAKADIINALQAANIDFDTNISLDIRRVIRLPSSVHGSTGNVCEFVNPKNILEYEPQNITEMIG